MSLTNDLKCVGADTYFYFYLINNRIHKHIRAYKLKNTYGQTNVTPYPPFLRTLFMRPPLQTSSYHRLINRIQQATNAEKSVCVCVCVLGGGGVLPWERQ